MKQIYSKHSVASGKILSLPQSKLGQNLVVYSKKKQALLDTFVSMMYLMTAIYDHMDMFSDLAEKSRMMIIREGT